MDWTELANKHRRGDGLPKMIREPSPSDVEMQNNSFFIIVPFLLLIINQHKDTPMVYNKQKKAIEMC